MQSRSLAINSTLILIATSIINTVLHELAHYLVGLYFGLKPELHHNYVNLTVDGPARQQMLVAAAGPAFSLVFGIIALYISIKVLKPSLLKLFTLWLGLGGILVFMGYILIAPIAVTGDTGMVFEYFGFSTYLSVGLAVLSFIVINKIFSMLAREFSYYRAEGGFDQRKTARQLFLVPILASIPLGTLLNLPVVSWVSLLPTIFMPMAYFSIMGEYYKLKITDDQIIVNEIPPFLVITTGLWIILFRMLV